MTLEALNNGRGRPNVNALPAGKLAAWILWLLWILWTLWLLWLLWERACSR
ncbi:hypothetical protein PHLH4_34180 [Pseudomonas sp. St316]|nr:hypothetical protein PHLH4_34180 [Pseudomonas sp. St316]